MTTPAVQASVQSNGFQPDFSLIVGAQAQRLYASFTPAQLALFESIDGSMRGVQGEFLTSAAPTQSTTQTTQSLVQGYPVSSTGSSQQRKRKRAKKPKTTSVDPFPSSQKAVRPLNSWIAFRSYYCKIFVTSQQKDISGFLTHLWQTDPFKAKWILLAKAYSLVRDAVGKNNAPLDSFIEIVATFIGIIPSRDYLSKLGWEISVDSSTGQNNFCRRFNPDFDTFDEALRTTTHSVTDIIGHISESSYMPDGPGRLNLDELRLKVSQDTLSFTSGRSPSAHSQDSGLNPLPHVQFFAAGVEAVEQAPGPASSIAVRSPSVEPTAGQSPALDTDVDRQPTVRKTSVQAAISASADKSPNFKLAVARQPFDPHLVTTERPTISGTKRPRETADADVLVRCLSPAFFSMEAYETLFGEGIPNSAQSKPSIPTQPKKQRAGRAVSRHNGTGGWLSRWSQDAAALAENASTYNPASRDDASSTAGVGSPTSLTNDRQARDQHVKERSCFPPLITRRKHDTTDDDDPLFTDGSIDPMEFLDDTMW
ncbi:MAG: hypothetical protein M1813_002045 [Trichoglossum hirsutum]|nr:MAG: hypothetical protein M1813_002045 [Trichoglossum hirsutum]